MLVHNIAKMLLIEQVNKSSTLLNCATTVNSIPMRGQIKGSDRSLNQLSTLWLGPVVRVDN